MSIADDTRRIVYYVGAYSVYRLHVQQRGLDTTQHVFVNSLETVRGAPRNSEIVAMGISNSHRPLLRALRLCGYKLSFPGVTSSGKFERCENVGVLDKTDGL